ncbi:glycosyltransferase [Gammaproteobacteria bacterium AH-315-C21]|nr:glycosyltransferase [Gammaproteobacteria bacterium AH-315-C21]
MISIITPVYNGKSYIESCLNVVINQHCHDIEHIVLDGGSTDGTVEVLQRYSEQYPHIHYLSEPDKGQSDAMNKGLKMAKGDIIGILNVDDYYEPNVLARIPSIFQGLPDLSFVVGNCNVKDSNGKLVYINRPRNLKFTQLLKGWRIHPHPVNPIAYFYHKTIHDKIGPYDINEHYAMDLEFIYRITQIANLKYIDEIWGNYIQFPESKTQTDKARGKSTDRAEAVRVKFRNKLPLIRRYLYYIEHHYAWFKYKFKRKIQRIFNS